VAGGFPFPFLADHQVASVSSATEQLPASDRGLIFDALSPRRGEDVLLTNVIAFDVRMFDPAAAIDGSGPTPLSPGDAVAPTGGSADQGTNGLDDAVPARADGRVAAQDADGVADDSGELETAPPYPFPLRGIEVRICCYEPESRQVRQCLLQGRAWLGITGATKETSDRCGSPPSRWPVLGSAKLSPGVGFGERIVNL
jgi:hypothetical protein